MFLQNKIYAAVQRIVSVCNRGAALACILFIRVYKVCISPFLPRACRYYPTCSDYSAASFRKYGMVKGFYLSIRRVLRCNPFFPGGHDPVP